MGKATSTPQTATGTLITTPKVGTETQSETKPTTRRPAP